MPTLNGVHILSYKTRIETETSSKFPTRVQFYVDNALRKNKPLPPSCCHCTYSVLNDTCNYSTGNPGFKNRWMTMVLNNLSGFSRWVFSIVCLHLFFSRNTSGSRLLVILLDGFRWDYLEQDGHMLPGFESILQHGVKAEYLIPVYPTLSYPNYYSIMTG